MSSKYPSRRETDRVVPLHTAATLAQAVREERERLLKIVRDRVWELVKPGRNPAAEAVALLHGELVRAPAPPEEEANNA